MKNLLTLLIVMVPLFLTAQDAEPENPKDSGIEEFDSFKNSSFRIFKESKKFRTKVDNGEKFTPEDINAVDKLQKELSELQGKTEAMMSKAKEVKPPTKVPTVTSNTKEAGKALKLGAANLKYVTENMVKEEE
jgi:hypothetical protein